ncbi:MAG: DMT family transporter [Bacillota bacterium]
MGEILALGSALSFGISSIFIGRAAVKNGKTDRDLGLLITILINVVISSAAFIVYVCVKGLTPVSPVAVVYFILVGVFSSFLGRALFFEGITYIGPARSSAIKLFGPVFTIFVGVVFLKETLSLLSWTGLLVVLGGLLVVAWETVLREKRENPEKRDILAKELILKGDSGKLLDRRNIKGVILGLMAGSSYGTATVFRRLGMQADPNPFLGTWIAFITSLSLYLPYMYRLYGWKRLVAAIKGAIDINYLYSGIFTGAAQFQILLSLNYIGIGIANTLLNTDAVFTAVIGYFILGNRERINHYTVFGVISVTVGVFMILAGK